MSFDIKKAVFAKVLWWERIPLFRFTGFFQTIFFWFSIFLIGFFLYGFLKYGEGEILRRTLGFLCLSVGLWLFFGLSRSFLKSLVNIRRDFSLEEALTDLKYYNLADFLDWGSFKIFHGLARGIKDGQINSSQVLEEFFESNKEFRFFFTRLMVNLSEFRKELRKDSSLQDIDSLIVEAGKIALRHRRPRISSTDILIALASLNPVLKKALFETHLKDEDLDNLVSWVERIKRMSERKRRFWDYENLARNGTLAKNWTAGYTVNLDRFSRDLNDDAKARWDETVGHEQEIQALETILSRREFNNAILVGESGTGRKSIILELARKSIIGKSSEPVNHKSFVEIDMTSLLAQITNPEELEVVLDLIFREALSAGNVILIISDFHNYAGNKAKPGSIDISGMLTPYLRFPQFQIVGITDHEGYRRFIEPNSALASLFEKVEVKEISSQETLGVLQKFVPSLEDKHRVFIPYQTLKETVELAERYFPSQSFPEKALTLLDETVVRNAKTGREGVILPRHVAHLVSQKTEVPVGEIQEKERGILLNLENLIHQRIVDQEEAVTEISSALRRARTGVTIRKGPIGAFLFIGPTGVGKTETAKALAEFYFGSEERMIRLDMSEFQNPKDLDRLIGDKDQNGILVTAVREDPFSVLLLDEIEKSNPNVLNLFLQILDEGYCNDWAGKKVDFRNCIIIATSNAGYQVILRALEKKEEWSALKKQILDHVFEKGIFRPEFINRFDGVVLFKPLDHSHLVAIAGMMLKKLALNLKEKKSVEFIITEELKSQIAQLGYDPVFGARAMKRVVQEKVENIVSAALLKGDLYRGSSFAIDPSTFQIIRNAPRT